MRKLFYALLLSLCPFCLHAQVSDEYKQMIKQAEVYYSDKQYKKSAEAYVAALKISNVVMTNDAYNAASAMAQAGMTDSAFSYLNLLAKASLSDYSYLIADTTLVSLHNDVRWAELCKKVKENKDRTDKEEANYNKPLIAILDTVYTDDQGGRMQLAETTKKYSKDSWEMKELWRSIKEKDSINQVKVESILDQYGWLGSDIVGWKGNRTLFLVIQHSGLKTQEKYLPMLRQAVKDKKASASNLALLEDRVALGEGKKQIYGSQISTAKNGEYYIRSLEDPDNVDKRRAEVGLAPLADYLQHWQLKWDPEVYKKQLPEIEKWEKEASRD